jgi:hypothetical protein
MLESILITIVLLLSGAAIGVGTLLAVLWMCLDKD